MVWIGTVCFIYASEGAIVMDHTFQIPYIARF